MTGPVYIYALGDPETGLIRYIGKSIRPEQRIQNHINEKPTNCHRSHWLQSLKAKGLQPLAILLEEIRGAWPWQESERYWIARGRREGWPLTNNTDGGDGVTGLPEKARAKMAATWRGRKHRPESLEKMRIASTGRRHSDESKAARSAMFKGRKITWVGKVAEALRKFDDTSRTEVKRRLDAGERTGDLAREFKVHRTTISKIKMGTYLGKY